MAETPAPTSDSSNYFDISKSEPAIPQANELLTLKILKEANPDVFRNVAQDETKWLSLAFASLRQDPYLQLQLGGRGVRQAMKLANLLKMKAEQRHFDKRVENIAEKMVDAQFKIKGWEGLAPKNEIQWLKDAGDGDIEMKDAFKGGRVILGND